MNREFAIRCTPTDIQWPSYLVNEESGEVRYFPTIEAAVAEAICYQDKTRSDVTYVVVEIGCSSVSGPANQDRTDRARPDIEP